MKKKLLVLTTLALAALAQPVYAGWYLMAPPADDSQVYAAAPINAWQQIGAFDSAYQCESAMAYILNSFQAESDYQHYHSGNPDNEPVLSRKISIQRTRAARCLER